ncbi:hypothetical protein [Chitinibacter tainanensis]|uniref:hypothetical protein n=1 Tax=Chitinibacter tainanensis TaxID=230667 RepID=UPI0023544F09|nr:hypothetical protein [Chitinibacter tainanensis]
MTQEIQNHVFCLMHESGEALYPVKMKNRATGVTAYRVSKSGNTLADCIELHDEQEVLRYVRDLGYGVRARGKHSAQASIYKLDQRSITELRLLKSE